MKNECKDSYGRGVIQLASDWRVVESWDGIQWILQKAHAPKKALPNDWDCVGYFRTSEALKRSVSALKIDLPTLALAALAELPAWIEGDFGPVPTLRYGRHTRAPDVVIDGIYKRVTVRIIAGPQLTPSQLRCASIGLRD